MRPKNPYDKGPLKKHEIPGMVIGAGILVGGIYGLARFLTNKTRAAQATAPEQLATRGAIDFGRWR